MSHSARELISSIRESRLLPGTETIRKILQGALNHLTDGLYTKDTHFILEFVQNADDNTYPPGATPSLRIRLEDDRIVISSNEVGFSNEDVRAICSADESTKVGKKDADYIGEKGIGFKSAFKVADVIHIASRTFKFKFDRREPLGMIVPIWDDDAPATDGETTFALDLNGDAGPLAAELSSIEPSLLLFTRRLRSIRIDIRTTSPSASFSATYTCSKEEVHSDAFAKVLVSREVVKDGSAHSLTTTYLVMKHSISMQDVHEPKRSGVRSSEIVLAFPIQKDGSPEVSPQNVFAYLPLGSFGFKFIVQADFVTSSNRQDILEDSAWNCRLRDEIPTAFCSAVDLFLRDAQLRFTWPLYLNGEVSHQFFGLAMDKLISKLAQKPIVMDRGEKWQMVDCVLALPSRFCIKGEPLVDPRLTDGRSYLHDRSYLHGRYSELDRDIVHVLERRFSLKKMQDRHFFDALWKMSSKRSFGREHSEWHRVVASRLCEIYDRSSDLRRDIERLWIIPLSDRTWTATTWHKTGIYFPNGSSLPRLPAHLNVLVVHADADAIPERHAFFHKMGVRDICPQDIASQILTTQDNTGEAGRIDNAHFFFSYRHLEPPLDYSSLLFALENGGSSLGHHAYLDDPADGERLRKALPEVPFVAQSYVRHQEGIPETQREQWLSWLIEGCGLRTIPDPHKDLPDMAQHLPLDEFLDHLQYFWPRLPHERSTWQSMLADTSVKLIGRNELLRDTCLRRGRLTSPDYDGLLPFLPIDRPQDSCWDFLPPALGVSTNLDAKQCLQLLSHTACMNPDPVTFERVQELYTQLDARFSDDPDFEEIIRERFASQKLLFIPGDKQSGRKALWLNALNPKDNVFWDGPSSLAHQFYLDRFYPQTLRDFFDRVVSMGGESTVRLYRLNQVYVPGRYSHFTDAFRASVPLLVVSGSIRTKAMLRFWNSPACSGLVRKLDEVVVSRCAVSDPGVLDPYWMAGIEQKYPYIEREVIRAVTHDGQYGSRKLSPEQTTFLSSLKAVEVRRVTRIDATLTLENIEVRTNESVWIDDTALQSSGLSLKVYMVLDGDGKPGASGIERSLLEDRLHAEIARRLSIPKREITRVMVTPVEILERLLECEDDILPTLEDLQGSSERTAYAYKRTVDAGHAAARTSQKHLSGIARAPRTPGSADVVSATTQNETEEDTLANRVKNTLSRIDFTSIAADKLAARVCQSHTIQSAIVSSSPSEVSHTSSADHPTRALIGGRTPSPAEELDGMRSQMANLSIESPSSTLIFQQRSSPTLYQQVNGILGERIVFELLSRLLGRSAALECWTSELRGKCSEGFPEYSPTASTWGDFTISDPEMCARFGAYLYKARPDRLEAYTKSEKWPRFHLEVKSTSEGPHVPFHLSNRQFEIAKELHMRNRDGDHSTTLPSDVFVLVRVWDVQSPKPSLNNMAFYADPFQGLLDGQLRLVSDSVEISLVDVPV
ncbi:unnamed protein product [Peniophora sp. CBMAI 1063]|nr:unnamed protein product [Peniophora sp. CBMAI 1063]